MTTLHNEYCALRVGLHSLFERIEDADAVLKPYIDAPETVRVWLADYFYGDIITPPCKKVYISDRIIAFKDTAAIEKIWSPQADEALKQIAEFFWELSEYIQHNVLKASATYTHTSRDCFYQYAPEEKSMVVYVPVLPGLEQVAQKVPCAAVIQGCYHTLPSFLKTVFEGLLKKQTPSQNVAQLL